MDDEHWQSKAGNIKWFKENQTFETIYKRKLTVKNRKYFQPKSRKIQKCPTLLVEHS